MFMGAGRRVEAITTDAVVNGHANGHAKSNGRLVELTSPATRERVKRAPLRDLPEGMHIVADVAPHSLLARLFHIGARIISADATMPERYSFYDGTHFEFGPEGPVFVMEGLGPYDSPQRIDLREAAVRETLDYTTERVTSQLEFVFPFDELLQGHSGVRVLTITPHSRGIRHVSVKDYASLPDREREIVDVGRILHNLKNAKRNRGDRRHIR